ncbi:heme-binding protein [Streptomyces sp. NPDC019645]|uniref:GlcG/HbpS family heme-binding protein n=1 Tax=Streptomyces sp. NPDC019645 TaxID=3154786 RepID=UPI00340CF60A
MKEFSPRARVLTGAFAAAALGAATFGAVSANASAPAVAAPAAVRADATNGNLRQTAHLTVAAATETARAVLEAAPDDDQRVTVAVVDRNGDTIVVPRGDGAGPQSYESAERKAFTAVSWNAPTSESAERLRQAPDPKDPRHAVPRRWRAAPVEGRPIAGIGVAGAPSGDLDEPSPPSPPSRSRPGRPRRRRRPRRVVRASGGRRRRLGPGGSRAALAGRFRCAEGRRAAGADVTPTARRSRTFRT